MKLYVHHRYNESLYYKLVHNTTDKEFIETGEKTTINLKYKNKNIQIVFKEEMSFEDDGYHVLDFFTALLRGEIDKKIGKIVRGTEESESIPILKIFNNLLVDAPINQKWLILFFRTEKILQKHEVFFNERLSDIERQLDLLNKHYIISDNFFIYDSTEKKYKNHFTTLTNIIFQWNELFGINWFYCYKDLFSKLNFDYDLSYCVRNHKFYRVKLLKLLYELKNDRIYLQRTDTLKNDDYYKYNDELSHININSIYGNNDFTNRSYQRNHDTILGMDQFFKVFTKSKLWIVDESWAWANYDFTSNYLSEKTFGPLLINMPFISTHSYPLDIISKMLKIDNHPFYHEIRKTNGDPDKFCDFVRIFMEDFDSNFNLCKEWVETAHNKLLDKINNENSLLDLILSDFKIEEKPTKINII